ncbi:MAG: peptidase MA family metallohydrolase [Bacteroidota bacterium]|nr:peptidase MA family metallohydrolase [Bacteroidota bacterium]
MNNESKDLVLNQPFFNSMIKSLIACLVTVLMLIIAYLVPWCSWFAWFAFIPFMLSVKGHKRIQMYILTLTMLFLYYLFVIFVYSQQTRISVRAILILVAFSIIISEVQIFCRRVPSMWGWIPAALLYTAFLLIYGLFDPATVNQIGIFFCIIPVSRLFSKFIAFNYCGYIILFAVLLANGFASEKITRSKRKVKYTVIISITIIASIVGLLGGPAPATFSFNARSQGLVLQLESNHFRFFSNTQDRNCLKDLDKSLEDNYSRVTNDLKTRIDKKVDIYIYSDLPAYHKASFTSDTPWAIGNAVGSKNVIQMAKPDKVDETDKQKDVIVHEFTHIVIMKINPINVPIWLNEGVASYEANYNSKINLVVSGFPTFKDLEKNYNTFAKEYGYTFSGSIVDYIVNTYGYDKLYALIKSPAKFEKIMGISKEAFQKKWVSWVAQSV